MILTRIIMTTQAQKIILAGVFGGTGWIKETLIELN
jgi:hypothetical protein